MSDKILSIVEGAFRATLEEQDDAALWFTAAVRNSGSDTNIMLRNVAVHYALQDQRRPRLQIGDMVVENPPEFDADLMRLMEKGGIQASRIVCETYGPYDPIDPSSKSKNRRVQIVIAR